MEEEATVFKECCIRWALDLVPKKPRLGKFEELHTCVHCREEHLIVFRCAAAGSGREFQVQVLSLTRHACGEDVYVFPLKPQ